MKKIEKAKCILGAGDNAEKETKFVWEYIKVPPGGVGQYIELYWTDGGCVNRN